MSLGLVRKTVRLEAHDPLWDRAAREAIALLRDILGPDARDIQHVGSTAIPSVRAKPIVDIAVGVNRMEDMRRHDEELAARGVVFRSEDHPGQLLYVMGDFAADTRTHHIHVVPWQGEEWKNYVAFRDYLNAFPEQAARYARLKEELSERYAHDRGAYTAGKGALIGELIAAACAWRAE